MAPPEYSDRSVGRGGHRAGGVTRGGVAPSLRYAWKASADWLAPAVFAVHGSAELKALMRKVLPAVT